MADKKNTPPTKKASVNLAVNAFAAKMQEAEDLKSEILQPSIPIKKETRPTPATMPTEELKQEDAKAPKEPSKNELAENARPKPLVVVPQRREPKDVQKQVRVTKTLNSAIEAKCAKLGIPYNEVANQLLQAWVDMEE